MPIVKFPVRGASPAKVIRPRDETLSPAQHRPLSLRNTAPQESGPHYVAGGDSVKIDLSIPPRYANLTIPSLLARAQARRTAAKGAGRQPMAIDNTLLARVRQPPPVVNPFRLPDYPANVIPPVESRMAMDDFGGMEWAGSVWTTHSIFSTTLAEGLAFPGYPFLAELAQRPEYRRFAEVIATEMTRKWIRLQSTADEDKDGSGQDKTQKITALDNELKRLRVRDVIHRCIEIDEFFGRSHLYIDTGDTDNREELITSIGNGKDELSRGKIGIGSVRAVRAVEPVWCYPTQYDANDPLKEDWYDPIYWFVLGKQVHRTRLLKFVGREVPDLLKPAYSFGGLSISQMEKAYVDNWLRTRQSVADLIHAFSIFVLSTNMGATVQEGGDMMLKRVELFNMMRDNRGMMMVDKETETLANVSAPLGGLELLQAQSQEHMASIAGIPLVKLLGIQPAGLNASSDGEIRVFYDWILASQEKRLRHNLTTIIDLVQLSLWGEVDEDITFTFEPLWSLDEKGQAETREVEARTGVSLIDGGVLSPEEVRKSIAADPDSPYASIDVDDVPDLKMEEEGGLDPKAGGGQKGIGKPPMAKPGEEEASSNKNDNENENDDESLDDDEELSPFQQRVRERGERHERRDGGFYDRVRARGERHENKQGDFYDRARQRSENNRDYLKRRRMAHDEDWEEGKHPRDTDGQFGSGGGLSTPRKLNTKKEVKKAADEVEAFHDFLSSNYATDLKGFEDPDIERLNDIVWEWEPEDADNDPNFPLDRGPIEAVRYLMDNWGVFDDEDFEPDEEFNKDLRELSKKLKPIKDVKVDNTILYNGIEELLSIENLPVSLKKKSAPFLKKVDKFYDQLGSDPWLTSERLDDIKHDLDGLMPEAVKFFGDEIEQLQEKEDFDEEEYLPSEELVDKLREFKKVLTQTQKAVAKQEQMLVEMSTPDMAHDADWEEGKHPRGQPGNAGQFGSGGGGAPAASSTFPENVKKLLSKKTTGNTGERKNLREILKKTDNTDPELVTALMDKLADSYVKEYARVKDKNVEKAAEIKNWMSKRGYDVETGKQFEKKEVKKVTPEIKQQTLTSGAEISPSLQNDPRAMRMAATTVKVAQDLKFKDMKKLRVSDERMTFTLNGVELSYAGSYAPGTGVVTVFAHAILEHHVAGIVAHEVMHDKWSYFNVAGNELIEALHNGDLKFGPDGSISEFTSRDKYPRFTALTENFTEIDPQIFADTDGVTTYSRDWWKAYKAGKATLYQAVNETLAEMSSLKYERQEKSPPVPDGHLYSDYNQSGAVVSTEVYIKSRDVWHKLFNTVNEIYDA